MSHTSMIAVKMWKNFRQLRRLWANNNNNHTSKFCNVPLQHNSFQVQQKFLATQVYQGYEFEERPLRIDPYDTGRNGYKDDQLLQSIVDATTMQQVFDLFKSPPNSQSITERHSSQCLMTLWDIQKFMFQLRHPCVSQESEYTSLHDFISAIKAQPQFQNIVDHLVENCEKLNDVGLATSLLSLIKFKYKVRHKECQKLLNELLRRKETLSLDALTRLSVCLKSESIYGILVMNEFLPLLFKYITEMNSDVSVRLVSITLRNAYAGLQNSVYYKFAEKLKSIDEANLITFKPVTLLKLILLFFEIQYLDNMQGAAANVSFISLLRQFSHRMTPVIHHLETIDILSLSRFYDFQHEPRELMEALSKRIQHQYEKTTSLELVAFINPTSREQVEKIEELVQDCMDKHTFPQVSHFIYRVLRNIDLDAETCDKFWSKMTDLITYMKRDPNIDTTVVFSSIEINNDELFQNVDLDTFDDNPTRRARVTLLKCAYRYLHLCKLKSKPYSHLKFERLATREILSLLSDYDTGKAILSPSEYAICISFLIAFKSGNFEMRPLFFKNFKTKDLMLIAKSIRISRGNWHKISHELRKRCQDKLRENSDVLQSWELTAMARIDSTYQIAFDSSPVFSECFHRAAQSRCLNTKVCADLTKLTLVTGYYDPLALERVSKYICSHEADIPLRFAELFVLTGFMVATDFLDAYPIVARIIEWNFHNENTLQILQTTLSLLYHGCLSNERIHKIFSLEFLDAVDKEIKNVDVLHAKRIRSNFMELNRAVCLDQPSANLPWFHEKYCQEIIATAGWRESYLHTEVQDTLEEILGGPNYVSKGVYAPYYYLMDFLLQFDEHGRPMTATKEPSKEAVEKVAVLIHNPKDFTTNVRQLKGSHRLKNRHLEMLGYRVINVDPWNWNSMYMSELGYRAHFLKEKIDCFLNKMTV